MAGPDRVFQQRDNGPRTDVVDDTNCFLELRDRRTDGPGPQKLEETSAVHSCTTVCLIQGVVVEQTRTLTALGMFFKLLGYVDRLKTADKFNHAD